MVLNLTDCGIPALLYYLNQDLPILVRMKDGHAVLLTGFNDTEVVVMDPLQAEPLFKITKKEAEKMYEEKGATCLSYIRL